MKAIGITGGIGSGKTRILKFLKEEYNCQIIYADLIAKECKKRGNVCYNEIVALLGENVLDNMREINNEKMAEQIFSSPSILQSVNAIIHPQVKNIIVEQIENEKKREFYDVVFVEAALLIEDGYQSILDEIWYVYAKKEIRLARLFQERGMEKEKAEKIMNAQCNEAEFKKWSHFMIDNSGNFKDTKEQIEKKMGDFLWQKRVTILDN